MKYSQNTPLGNIEYTEENRISLPQGIPGFEGAQYAIWYTSPDYEPIKWLILEHSEAAVLPLLDPFLVTEGYEPVIPDYAADLLEVESPDHLAVLCVASPKKSGPPTINLRSPIVINVMKRIAIQVILEDESLPIRYEWSRTTSEAEQC